MRLLRSLLRRSMDLPAARSRAGRATEWVAMSDGTRLETVVIQPIDLARAESCLLIRSEQPLPCKWGSLFAEQGHVIVMQQCRGRGDSEGSFEPFLHEGDDGGDAVDWISAQPWFGGQLGVVGFGYAGFAAWAAQSARPDVIRAMAVGLATRSPHRSLYVGGALQLEWALHLASRFAKGDRSSDLARGVRTRPIREADRVALRRSPWYREWVDHPAPAPYWEERTPALPSTPPKSLLFAGLYHPTLAAELDDFTALRDAGAECELFIGPWAESPLPRKERSRDTSLMKVSSRAMLDFFGRAFRGQPPCADGIQICVGPGTRWRKSPCWPPAGARTRIFYLHGDSEIGDLGSVPPEQGAPPGRFVYDPADAAPSLAGARINEPGGRLLAGSDLRGDCLRFETGGLESDLDLIGPASLVIHVSSDAPCTDFTARLLEVDRGGALHLLGESIARVRDLRPARSQTVQLDFHAVARRVRTGSRLRVEIGSASFPRFDRHPNRDVDPARCARELARPACQVVYHDAEHPSQLRLTVAP